MVGIELACAGILLLHVGVALKLTADRGVFLRRFFLFACASWIAEDTCIRFYGFYSYNPDWSIFLDQMPLMIALIWPSVILSAWEVAQCLIGKGNPKLPWLVGALVLADAWLIEPISVHSGLWQWYEPGLFDVPPIGVLGWAIFAVLAIAVLERAERQQWDGWKESALLVVAPVGSHLLLITVWWGFFRWVNHTVPTWPAVALVLTMSLILAWFVAVKRYRDRMPAPTLFSRMPPAIFFFVLLALYGRDAPALIMWAIAFAPPWLALTPWGSLRATSEPATAS